MKGLIWLAACWATLAVPVWAQDGLPRLPLTYAPAFDAIGRLGDGIFEKQGCTGTLIAPDLVLTAGHCVRGTGQGGAVFVAGWRGTTEAGRASVARTLRHPDYDFGNGRLPKNDVALAILEAPLDSVPPLRLSMPPVSARKEVALLGYHAGAPGGLTGAFDCPLLPRPDGTLAIQCPVVGGNSGTPVVVRQGGNWEVRGVVSSRAGTTGAIAMPLDPWLRAQIEAHLAAR